MIKLYGVQLSAYYNKVKIALLEKGVNFQEVPTRPSQEPAMLEQSPMGKIPYVDINGHALSESTVILEWLEDAYPTAALLPPTPNGRACARELMTMLDLYLMPATAPLYRHLLFGAALDDAGKATAKAAIERSLLAVSRLVQYGPWLAGEYFSFADISAACVLPLVAWSTREVYGEDLTTIIPGIEEYLALLGKRASVVRMWQDSAAARAALLEARQ
ncbi:glutathione S-transferase family protein [Aquitalea sp. LB_tupeE]|uniref:glutathione S-transferase family protein n=1 Tax=Aquitalea sp. LB_tupeE TaxID=2748078 RepID=UPI0015BAE4CD|nr:glutathione S-transferase family protein [Aquitalea sp. LB_tupeE]NWK77590.1 glutathione S-transferase family protein [Aquitalea sp. LB_tupeE]